jgi:hypothetical protein
MFNGVHYNTIGYKNLAERTIKCLGTVLTTTKKTNETKLLLLERLSQSTRIIAAKSCLRGELFGRR